MKTTHIRNSLLAAGILAALGVTNAVADVTSTFDADMDGWSETPTSDEVTWQSSGGNPDGFLQFVDTLGGPTWITAPPKFHGSWAAYTTFCWDQKMIAGSDLFQPQVTIWGRNGTNVTWWPDSTTGPTDWVHLVMPLQGAIQGSNMTIQDPAVFQSILSDVTNVTIMIDGSPLLGGDIEGVDNVMLAASVLLCASDKTVECGSPWSFDLPTYTNVCCGTNVSFQLLNTNVTVINSCTSVWTAVWQAMDCWTNIATCTQTVTVVDTQAPILTCAPDKTVEAGTAWEFDLPTASDACCGTNVTITSLLITTNGNCCTQLIAQVWQAVDCCTNIATCTQTVTVVDATAPSISACPPDQTILASDPKGLVTIPDLRNQVVATDACQPLIVTQTPLGIPVGAGTHPVIFTVFDACGNSATCTNFLTVQRTNVCVPPPAGLAAWWTFDEAAGPTASDLAGAVNNLGTYIGSPTPVAGIVSNALCFDGVSGFVLVTNHAEINFAGSCTNEAESFTIDAWIRADTNGTEIQAVLDKRVDPNNTPQGYLLYLLDGKLGIHLATGADGWQNHTAAMPDLRDAQWHFIAVTVARCGTAGNAGIFYLDGDPVSSFLDPQTGDLDNSADLLIGQPYGYYATGYRGCLDELEIIKRVLTPEEIKGLYDAGSAGKCRGMFCGRKFNDLNGDGVQQAGEPGLEGWVIEAVTNGVLAATTITDSDGDYCFSDLPVGLVSISEVQQPGWVQTCPSSGTYVVTVGNGPNTDLNFGNCTNCIQMNCTNLVFCSLTNVVLPSYPVAAWDICQGGVSVPLDSVSHPLSHAYAPGTVTTVSCSAGNATCSFTVTVNRAEQRTLALHNTGVDGAGTLLNGGDADSHYDLLINPDNSSPQPFVVYTNAPAFQVWLPNDATSQWIGPTTNGAGASGSDPYCYRTRFTLPCTNDVVITGQWAVDNDGTIVLNTNTAAPVATLAGGESSNFTNWHAFTITNGFVAGQNTLDFWVTNRDDSTGLRVELSGTVTCCCDQYPLLLESAEVVTGPYTAEPGAVVDQNSRTITVAQSGSMRFYRIRSSCPTRIVNIVVSGSNVVLTYQFQ